MKNLIFKMVYRLSRWLERLLDKEGDDWQDESAPYCGYHECGHSGMLTHSYYYEGDGFDGVHAGNWQWDYYEDIKKTSLTYKQYRPLYHVELKAMKWLWNRALKSGKHGRVTKLYWWIYPKCHVSNSLSTHMWGGYRRDEVAQ